MHKKCALLLLFISTALGTAYFTNSDTTPTEFRGIAMTVPYRVVIGQNLSAKKVEHVQKIIDKVFDAINCTFNKWNPQSEISAINQANDHEPIPLSPSLEHFLEMVSEVVSLSEQRFDPTIEPVQQLWKSHLEQGILPRQDQIDSLAAATGWDLFQIHNHRLIKLHPLTSLDLGGIAKGYAVDLLVKELYDAGYHHLLVDWGGELKASGRHPEGRPWTIFISRLGSPNAQEAVDIVELKNQAIATSGDYLQNWTVGEKKFCHIIDPRHCTPITISEASIASVSILADHCILADGIATAAMLFPSIQEAEIWLKKVQERYPTLQYWILARDPTTE